MKIEIKSRSYGSILFEGEFGSFKLALEASIKNSANLGDADLGDADLRGADLRGANLGGADLRGANLGGADLRGANLGGADLRDADLGGADLRGADLRDADLGDADLGDADLRGANLRGADLGEKTLRSFRDDVWAVLSAAPNEAQGVAKALRHGKVDGSSYEGDCACLVGTVANVRGCKYYDLGLLKPDSGRLAETWFMQISPGDTPEKSKAVKLALKWVETWIENMTKAFVKVGG